jgi:hypothetical protein
MEIPVPKFQAKTETEMKNYGVIKTVLTKLYDTENDLIKKRKDAFEDLKNVKEENPVLKKLYDKFSDEMLNLEKAKEEQVLKIKTKLIPTTDARITDAKKTKQKIGNYKNISSKTKDDEEKLEKLKRSGQDVKGSQISLNISQNKSTMNDEATQIRKDIMQYEADRIQNNKKIMLLLINYEMAYHAKSIEELTKLFNHIKGKDLKESIKNSVMSVGVSQNVYDEDEDNANEESEKNEDDEGDDDDDDKKLKASKLSKSRKSKNKSQKNDDDDDEDEIEKDNE